MTREHVRKYVMISVDGSYTVFGMDCTEDPVSNFRVTNDVIVVTVTG
jgi:hypothetical protein